MGLKVHLVGHGPMVVDTQTIPAAAKAIRDAIHLYAPDFQNDGEFIVVLQGEDVFVTPRSDYSGFQQPNASTEPAGGEGQVFRTSEETNENEGKGAGYDGRG